MTDEIWPGLWDLIWRWAEWYSILGSARGLQLKNPDMPRSTVPPRTKREEEFYKAFLQLHPVQRFLILAVLEREAEPWLEGNQWTSFFRKTELTPRGFTRHLRIALRTLAELARKRGL